MQQQMLRDGPYPPALRARVAGDWGHLSNAQAAALLGQLPHQCPLLLSYPQYLLQLLLKPVQP